MVAEELTNKGFLSPEYEAGARNLLENCVGFCGGQSVVIIGEDHSSSFFDPRVCHILADAVRHMGGNVEVVMAPETTGPEEFPFEIASKMQKADHTVFLSRLGDQMRFCDLPGNGTKTMCYLQDEEYLKDEFAKIDYRLFQDVNNQLLAELQGAEACRITCPSGSDLSGPLLPINAADADAITEDFSVKLFPVMIIPPLSARGLSGRLALGEWLTTTSTREYDESLLELETTVFAELLDGKIMRFDGEGSEVQRVERHFERVGQISGGDPFAVNSWHTGTNPKTFYPNRATDNLQKWSDVVYGSPRYTHFHACGNEPGDISISMFDASIAIDDVPFWENGKFVFLDRPDITRLRDSYANCQTAFDMRWDIGL